MPLSGIAVYDDPAGVGGGRAGAPGSARPREAAREVAGVPLSPSVAALLARSMQGLTGAPASVAAVGGPRRADNGVGALALAQNHRVSDRVAPNPLLLAPVACLYQEFGNQVDADALLRMDESLYLAGHLRLVFDQLLQTVPTDFLFSDKLGSNDGILLGGAPTLDLGCLFVPQRAVKGSRKAVAGRPIVNQSLRGVRVQAYTGNGGGLNATLGAGPLGGPPPTTTAAAVGGLNSTLNTTFSHGGGPGGASPAAPSPVAAAVPSRILLCFQEMAVLTARSAFLSPDPAGWLHVRAPSARRHAGGQQQQQPRPWIPRRRHP